MSVDRERDGVLAVARWGLLAWVDGDKPRLTPHALWSDGAGVWLALPVDGAEVDGLRSRPDCGLWVPPVDPDGPGVSVSGRARVFSVNDPLGLLVHSPVLSTAVLALAARNPGLVLEQARGLAAFPPRLPRNRTVVRIAIERLRGITPPAPPRGMAPALPPVIPADVRRALGGTHSVAVGLADGGARALPGVLGPGFGLTCVEAPADGAAVSVALVPCSAEDPLPGMGAALDGEVRGGSLLAGAARWWIGGREGAAELAGVGGVVLPD
jgi:hypothetical protein